MRKNLKVIRFLLFLLVNGSFLSFFKNRISNQAKYNKDKSILNVMSFVHKYIKRGDTVFYAAFTFKNSKEGHDYWVELSDKWMKTN